MCGGGGGGTSERLAVQSANQEQARQDRINEGMRQIELMFNGGKRATGQVGADAGFQAGQSYYDKNGNPWAPDANAIKGYQQSHGMYMPEESNTSEEQQMADVFGGFAPLAMSAMPADWQQRNAQAREQARTQQQAKMDEDARQAMFREAAGGGLFTGVEDTAGYGGGFYDKAYKAQLDYALPQVDRQYADAQKNLEFALARQGLNASSQAGQLQADLSRERELAIQGQQDKANSVRQRQMSAVEEERSGLTQLLQQTGDVQATMNAAAARKNIIEAAPAIEEVGPLFQNATGALADMIVSPSMRQAGQTRSGNAGYGAGKGSGKVVT